MEKAAGAPAFCPQSRAQLNPHRDSRALASSPGSGAEKAAECTVQIVCLKLHMLLLASLPRVIHANIAAV